MFPRHVPTSQTQSFVRSHFLGLISSWGPVRSVSQTLPLYPPLPLSSFEIIRGDCRSGVTHAHVTCVSGGEGRRGWCKHDLGHWTLITFFHYFFCSWEALTWHYLALLLDDAAPYSCYEKFRRYLHAIDGVTVTQSEILFNTFTFISIARLKCWFKTNVKQLLHDL